MTRQRPNSWICKDENCPHERAKKFNVWVRKKLPDSSTGYLATDLDFILYNYKTKRIMLLEIKTHASKPKYWQRRLFSKLSEWIERGITRDWKYEGYHLITFEKTSFNDGKCWLDNKEISEMNLIKFLSMLK